MSKKLKFVTKPYDHQLDFVEFGLVNSQACNFGDPGTGKTKPAIDLGRLWSKFEKIDHILVVAPLPVLWNWEKEIKNNSYHKSVVLYGTMKERRRLLELDVKFYIINYDAIIRKTMLQALLSKGFGAVIFDESIKLSNWKTKRTKAAYMLARMAGDNVLLLSGRPVSKGVENLFGQFWVLDGGKTFGKNYFRFRSRYFRKVPVPFPKYSLKRGALADIRHKIEKSSRIYRKEDCLDLPPQTTKKYAVVLSPEQVRYTHLVRTRENFHASKICEVDINSPLTMALKEQQITGGFIYGSRHGTRGRDPSSRPIYKFKENPKLDVLREILVEETNDTCIIVARYHTDLDLIGVLIGDLGLRYCEISGRTDTHKEKERYINSKDISVCICQISAASLGIDGLQTKCSNMIFYSFNYRLDDFEQMKLRIDRHGQTKPCTYYLLLAKDSVDEEIAEAIDKKRNISDYLMRRRRSHKWNSQQ